MQAVIMHPEGVAAGVSSPEARRHVDLPPEQIEEVVTRSKALPAAERLGVYAAAYHARLLECLREEYAVLARTLGEELFDEFAVGYLQKFPSRSYTLSELGRRFPAHLAESCPPEEGGESSWAAFLVDLATLEWTYDEVFDGPGVEGETPLTAEALLAIPSERWPEARLVFVPCFRLLALRYPVHEYYSAVRRDEDAVVPEPAEAFLAVTRRDYVIRRYPLAPDEYELLQALAAGQTVGRAVALAAEKAGPDLPQLVSNLRGWFARWASEEFFQAVELPA
jgi:hypothetical protein